MTALTQPNSPLWVEEANRLLAGNAASSEEGRELARYLRDALDVIAEYRAAEDAIRIALGDDRPGIGSVGFYSHEAGNGYYALKAYKTPDGRYLCGRGEAKTPFEAVRRLVADFRVEWLKDPRRGR